MRLIVSDIPDDGLQKEIELPITLFSEEKPAIAHVFLKTFKISRKVLVEGSVNMTVLLKCGRCLKEFSYPFDVTFRDEYNPAEDIDGEDEYELTNRELDLSFYSNDEIDITELVKEQMLLSVPMKPLCKSECQGICPRCGKDLNQGSCECKAEEIDPRLTPLEKFKELIKDRKTS